MPNVSSRDMDAHHAVNLTCMAHADDDAVGAGVEGFVGGPGRLIEVARGGEQGATETCSLPDLFTRTEMDEGCRHVASELQRWQKSIS
ncbi:hypothetical protein IP78_08850 [Brevundimonas sp. AAP58]|nr:hypothetical protein IP78_08850 [Brevundimonas sp. AAP58]